MRNIQRSETKDLILEVHALRECFNKHRSNETTQPLGLNQAGQELLRKVQRALFSDPVDRLAIMECLRAGRVYAETAVNDLDSVLRFLEDQPRVRSLPKGGHEGRSTRESRVCNLKLTVQEMHRELIEQGWHADIHKELCRRLGNTPRPPQAAWRHLPWSDALARFPQAVKTWLSKAVHS